MGLVLKILAAENFQFNVGMSRNRFVFTEFLRLVTVGLLELLFNSLLQIVFLGDLVIEVELAVAQLLLHSYVLFAEFITTQSQKNLLNQDTYG